MGADFVAELQQLGLSTAEAQIYAALVAKGPLGAAAISSAAGIQRSNVYAILAALADIGLVEGGASYGSRFTAVSPDTALPSLIVRERETLAERERLAHQLAERMAVVASPAGSAPEDLIQVVRNPKVIAERFERLQAESKQQVDVIVKAPILNPRRDNPAQRKAQRRGVRYRGLYERAAVEDPQIAPYLQAWVSAGEQARVYDGTLPNKLAIFDTQVVLLPLSLPGDQMRTLFIRHRETAQSLSMLFEFLWERGEPVVSQSRAKRSRRSDTIPQEQNGRRLIRARPTVHDRAPDGEDRAARPNDGK